MVVCVLHSAFSFPADNVTVDTDSKTPSVTTTVTPTETSTDATPTPASSNDKIDVNDKLKKIKEKEILRKTYLDSAHGDRRPFKTNKPFPNFPALQTGDDSFGLDAGKRDFMIKLFFGRDPIDFDIGEDQEQPRYPSKPDGDLKEMPFYPPQFPGTPERDAPSKFDVFPFDRVAQPYDSSKNINNQKQEFLNKEYNFKPFFNFNEEEQRMSELERYEYLLEQRRRFDQNRDVRYVFHPYFGYIPTDEVNEDIVDDINLDQLFQLHPRHGFVPAMDDMPGAFAGGYDDRFTANFNGDTGYPKMRPMSPNGDSYGPGPMPMSDDSGYPKKRPFSPNGDPFGAEPMPMGDEKPLTVKVIGKPNQEEPSDESYEEMDFLQRNRREPQVIVPTYLLQPASPYVSYPPNQVFQNPSVIYQPQNLYGPDLRNVQPQPTKPFFTLTDAMRLRSDVADVNVGNEIVDDSGDDDEEEISLPIDPPGALVANDPLPEKTFPIFPYDPEQDEPAAVAF